MRLIQLKAVGVRSILLILCSVIVILSLITSSSAWLFKNVQRTHNLVTSNSILTTEVYFLQSDNSRVAGSAYKDPQTGYYIVDLSNPAASNYATKLCVDIQYQGVTRSYVRVLVDDMWLASGSSIFKLDTVFNTSPGLWFDNRVYDSMYYYEGGSAGQIGMVYNNNETNVEFRI